MVQKHILIKLIKLSKTWSTYSLVVQNHLFSRRDFAHFLVIKNQGNMFCENKFHRGLVKFFDIKFCGIHKCTKIAKLNSYDNFWF